MLKSISSCLVSSLEYWQQLKNQYISHMKSFPFIFQIKHVFFSLNVTQSFVCFPTESFWTSPQIYSFADYEIVALLYSGLIIFLKLIGNTSQI